MMAKKPYFRKMPESEQGHHGLMTEKRMTVQAAIAEIEARHARYFEFLDQLVPRDATVGALTGPLAAEFGITDGEALGAWMHWMVLRPEGGTPEYRSKMLGGF